MAGIYIMFNNCHSHPAALLYVIESEMKSAEEKSDVSTTSVPVVKKIKFKEEEVVDKNGEKKIVRIILELTVNGSSYSYRKIQKTVKTKNK